MSTLYRVVTQIFVRYEHPDNRNDGIGFHVRPDELIVLLDEPAVNFYKRVLSPSHGHGWMTTFFIGDACLMPVEQS